MNICANRQNTLKNSNEIKYSMKITTFSSYNRDDKHKKNHSQRNTFTPYADQEMIAC